MRIQSFNNSYNSVQRSKATPQFKSNVCFNIQASCGSKMLCTKALGNVEKLCIGAASSNDALASYGSLHWVFRSPYNALCVITERTSDAYSRLSGLRATEDINACVEDILADSTTRQLPVLLDEEIICHNCVSRAQIGTESRLIS